MLRRTPRKLRRSTAAFPAGLVTGSPSGQVRVQVNVAVLGRLRVQVGRAATTKFRTQQVGGVLAYLACHRDAPVLRDVLLEMLWPGGDPALTRHRLSQAVSSLRTVLEPNRKTRGSILVADRESLRLAEPVSTDLEDFESAVARAKDSASAFEESRYLEEAVARYTGPLLPDRYEDWVEVRRHALESEFMAVLRRLRVIAADAGELESARQWAQRAADLDPLDEEALCEWLRVLVAMGQVGEAKRSYERFAQRLEAELGLTPDAETAAIVTSKPPSRRGRTKITTTRAERPAARSILAGGIVAVAVVAVRRPEEREALRSLADRLRQSAYLQKRGPELYTLGFSRIADAVGAIRTFRERTRQSSALAEPDSASCVLGLADLAPSKVSLAGPRIDRLLESAGLVAPGWTVATAGFVELLDASSEADTNPRAVVSVEPPTESGNPTTRWFALPALSPDGRGDATPTTSRRPGNCPAVHTRFYGREAEISEVRERILAGSRRLTLHGPGGAGKTRLALELASRLETEFPGGVWFVPLENIMRSAQVLSSVLAALSLTRPAAHPLGTIASHLESLPSLLVLDNLEQLIPAATPIFAELCDELDRTVVLFTSRKPVGLDGEERIALRPLPLPSPTADLTEWQENICVKLFADRARSADQQFRITATNAPAVVELVRHLDGLPLALELAAARVPVLSPRDIVRRFQTRTKLSDRRQERMPRHRQMEQLIDWSYRLLDPSTRTVLRALEVFRGGFDLGAAEAVTDDRLAGDALAELVDASLLSVDLNDGPRFRLLETVREFASERQGSARRRTLAHRHAEYYQNLAAQLGPKLVGGEAPGTIAALDAEGANLRAALDHLVNEAGQARSRKQRARACTAAIRLLDTVAEYWSIRGRAEEAVEIATALFDSLDGVEPELAARLYFHAGSFAVLIARYDDAECWLSEALERFERLGNRDYQARSRKALGVLAYDRGRLDDAESHHRAALQLHQEVGDDRAIAHSLQNLGNTLRDRGRLEDARTYYEKSLTLKRRAGSPRDLASTLMGLGNLAELMEDFDGAAAFHEECLGILRNIRDDRATAMSMANLGSVTARRGKLDEGIRLLAEAAALHHRVGAEMFAARSLLMIGLLPGVERDPEWLAPLLSAGVGWLKSLGVDLSAEVSGELETRRSRLLDELGPARLLALTTQGEAMTAEDAIAHAFDHATD